MSSIILGITNNRLIFNKRLFFKESVGLERIQEEYTFKTSNFEYFTEKYFLNGNPHSLISQSVDWSSGEKISYPTMTIERVEYKHLEGDLTNAIVTYVGLYSTQTPKPIIDITPITDGNWLYHSYVIGVTFVTSLGEPGSAREIDVVTKKFMTNGVAPETINGHKIPSGFKKAQGFSASILPNSAINTTWVTCPFSRVSCNEDINQIPKYTTFYGGMNFLGMVVSSMTIERFGLYGIVRLEIRDSAIYTISANFDACGGLNFNSCTSYLNYLPQKNENVA